MAQHENLTTDVLVVGAGASGIPAAIAAARAGAKVILIEEDPVIGGAPSDYYVCLFYGGSIHGIMREVDHLLSKRYTTVPGALFFTPESWQRAFWQLLQAEPNIQVIPGARAVAVLEGKQGHRPLAAGVKVETVPGQYLEIRSKVTIDATGSGIVAALAGCTTMYGTDAQSDFDEPGAPPQASDRVQHCTWMYFAQKTGWGEPLKEGAGVTILDGIAPRGEEDAWAAQAPERDIGVDPQIYLQWGCSLPCRDTRDPIELACTQTEALSVMEPAHARLRAHGYAVYLAPRIGVRECRRILGEYVITENHIRSGEFLPDTIAACDYGFDIWDEQQNWERGLPVARYGIPYRALVPRDLDGLLVAGKCISGTHIAMSSYRVMPIAAKTGQAAGVAAALSAKHNTQPRNLDPQELRRVLQGPGQNLQLSFAEE